MHSPRSETPVVRYAHSDEGWSGFGTAVRDTIQQHRLKRVLEIGGGANPRLELNEVHELGLHYSVLDISEDELSKAPAGYEKVCADISAPELSLDADYDFAFSHMLAEHVRSGERFHRNVFELLRPGGYALHFFPTLWAPPFVVNRWLPEGAADRLLRHLVPWRDRHRQAKFPAFYDWCRGPGRRQIERFEQMGYRVVRYDGYYGHRQYYERLAPLRHAHNALSRYLCRHPRASLTSFAMVLLRKCSQGT